MIIYKATNIVNGKVYIGKTVRNLNYRLPCHLSAAKRGSKYYFHVAIRKYGEDKFVWEVINDSAKTNIELEELEKIYIKYFKQCGEVYNLTDGGPGTSGIKFSDEHREKLSKAKLGTKRSKETKDKISKNHRSKKLKGIMTISSEVRKKISNSLRGRKFPNRKSPGPQSKATIEKRIKSRLQTLDKRKQDVTDNM